MRKLVGTGRRLAWLERRSGGPEKRLEEKGDKAEMALRDRYSLLCSYGAARSSFLKELLQ